MNQNTNPKSDSLSAALQQRDNSRNDAGFTFLEHLLTPNSPGKPESATFKEYYTLRFPSDLSKFYDIDVTCRNFAYPFVLGMEPPRVDENGRCYGHNKKRNAFWFEGDRHFGMFAAAVFYTSACAQVVGKLYGRKAMEDFHKASGWPMLNCGMGGLMSPVQVMLESRLYPCTAGLDDFIKVFDEASAYLEADFADFFRNDSANLDPVAYAAMRETADKDALCEELSRQRDLFLCWLRDPRTKYELYYIPIEMMRDPS